MKVKVKRVTSCPIMYMSPVLQARYESMWNALHGIKPKERNQHNAENRDEKALEAEVQRLQQKLHDNEERACDLYTELFNKSSLKQKELESEISNLRDELNDRSERVTQLEQRISWMKDEAAAHHEEKQAFEDALHSFELTRKDLEEEIARLRAEKEEELAEAQERIDEFKTILDDASDTIRGLRAQIEKRKPTNLWDAIHNSLAVENHIDE